MMRDIKFWKAKSKEIITFEIDKLNVKIL